MTVHQVLVAAIGTLLAVAAALAVFRILRGPTILDRMIASDVLLTTLMLVLGAEMALERRTDLIPVLLVLAGTAAFGTIAVARAVSKHDRQDSPEQTSADPLGTVDDAPAVLRKALADSEALDDDALDVDDLRPTGQQAGGQPTGRDGR